MVKTKEQIVTVSSVKMEKSRWFLVKCGESEMTVRMRKKSTVEEALTSLDPEFLAARIQHFGPLSIDILSQDQYNELAGR